MAIIKKINGIRGFIGTTYAVFSDDYKKCLEIFMSKKEAQEFADKYNKENK